MHTVHESISVLNMSRIKIAENRQSIIELVSSVLWLHEKLEHLVSGKRMQIDENKLFVEIYLKLDRVVSEIQDMIQNAMFHTCELD